MMFLRALLIFNLIETKVNCAINFHFSCLLCGARFAALCAIRLLAVAVLILLFFFRFCFNSYGCTVINNQKFSM